MPARILAVSCALALAPLVANAFDSKDLQGLWAESTQNHYACTATNRYQRLELAPDAKTLSITFESRARGGKTSAKKKRIALAVLRIEEHALTVRFVGHDDPADPLFGDWQMSFLGTGVYRWHLVSRHETLQPAPIVVRCEP